MSPAKIILRCHWSPGDIVMLTAAVRDLHRSYPGRFLTDVRTSCDALWTHNPHLTPLREEEAGVRILDCEYPLINESHSRPVHCLHGFIEFLNQQLGLEITLSEPRGDIHLSAQEKAWYSQVHEQTGRDTPFWIVAAGGKYDVTIKWWHPERFQRVVDHFRERILFVQVGQQGHHHPRLHHVVDLRGRTTLRELVRLVYHARGVLCPVTCLMHLAAAVEVRDRPGALRPCVVLAGGREPVHWEAYPGHQFLHTIGALPCCERTGCWRDRTFSLGDGDVRDQPDHLCLETRGDLPRCMDLISAEDVIRAIETYHRGGRLAYLAPPEIAPARRGIRRTRRNPFEQRALTEANVRVACEAFLRHLPKPPRTFAGRGIVMCAGGARLFAGAWVGIRLLRHFGCKLPIQLWHLGPCELSPGMARLLGRWDVHCLDALQHRGSHPARRLGGWELKAYAMLHAPFAEILFLDADNVPVRDPSDLFEAHAYRESGALFWPDFNRVDPGMRLWSLLGIEAPAHAEFESGQMLVDKTRHLAPLQLAWWMNEQSDFFYRYMHGDKETFHLAFLKLGHPFVLIPTPVHPLPGTMCQHDLQGRRLFQHRNTDKWSYFGFNPSVPGFEHEDLCRGFLAELRAAWSGRIPALERRRAVSLPRPSLPRPPRRLPRLAMISAPGREACRERTLARLAQTDLGAHEVWLSCDARCAPEASQWPTLHHLLARFLEVDEEYLLLLGDHLRFNGAIGRNLQNWPLLRDHDVPLASLYHCGSAEEACYPELQACRLPPHGPMPLQAALLSREAVRYWLEHRAEVETERAEPLPRLARVMRVPLWVHAPSLVEVTEAVEASTARHRVPFDPAWRANAPPARA